MGELTSSIAHEINQPLTAVVTCTEMRAWNGFPPTRQTWTKRGRTRKALFGTDRAGAILGRIRRLFKKEAPAQDWLGDERSDSGAHRISAKRGHTAIIALRTELTPDLPRVIGDRVQLQQVVLNLIINGMDAMGERRERPKEILIRRPARASPESELRWRTRYRLE